MKTDALKWTIGKLLISFIGLFTAVSPYLADWNITHIYNPAWPPHAKFHNAQTMVLGAFLGLISFYSLWFREDLDEKGKVKEASLFAVLYWLAQFPAILFPGTRLTDTGINHITIPVILGIELNQLIVNTLFVLPVLITGYLLEMNRLNKQI